MDELFNRANEFISGWSTFRDTEWASGVLDRFNSKEEKRPHDDYIRGWCEMDDAIKAASSTLCN